MANATVANNILLQLGGMGRLKAMVGATNFVYDDNSLKFKFKSCRKANVIQITLNSMDLYDIKFFKYNSRSLECKEVKEMKDIYNDMMKSLIEEFTGLYLSL